MNAGPLKTWVCVNHRFWLQETQLNYLVLVNTLWKKKKKFRKTAQLSHCLDKHTVADCQSTLDLWCACVHQHKLSSVIFGWQSLSYWCRFVWNQVLNAERVGCTVNTMLYTFIVVSLKDLGFMKIQLKLPPDTSQQITPWSLSFQMSDKQIIPLSPNWNIINIKN